MAAFRECPARPSATTGDARRHVVPDIVLGIVDNNPDEVVSFSLHDPHSMQPAVLDLYDAFVNNPIEIYNREMRSEIYFDVWMKPADSDRSFPFGTVGPFDVTKEYDFLRILQNDRTAIRHIVRK